MKKSTLQDDDISLSTLVKDAGKVANPKFSERSLFLNFFTLTECFSRWKNIPAFLISLTKVNPTILLFLSKIFL